MSESTGKKKEEVHICLRHIQRENAPLLVDKPIEVTNGYLLGFQRVPPCLLAMIQSQRWKVIPLNISERSLTVCRTTEYL